LACFSSHPVNLAGLLILRRLFISAFLILVSSSWLFYLLILMFLGGVIVIITYMTSLAANEKLFLVPNFKKFSLAPPLFLVLIFVQEDYTKFILTSEFSFVGGVFSVRFVFQLLTCFLLLLLAIIRVIKLIKLEDGPLVKRL